jgi:hypothetical protein
MTSFGWGAFAFQGSYNIDALGSSVTAPTVPAPAHEIDRSNQVGVSPLRAPPRASDHRQAVELCRMLRDAISLSSCRCVVSTPDTSLRLALEETHS